MVALGIPESDTRWFLVARIFGSVYHLEAFFTVVQSFRAAPTSVADMILRTNSGSGAPFVMGMAGTVGGGTGGAGGDHSAIQRSSSDSNLEGQSALMAPSSANVVDKLKATALAEMTTFRVAVRSPRILAAPITHQFMQFMAALIYAVGGGVVFEWARQEVVPVTFLSVLLFAGALVIAWPLLDFPDTVARQSTVSLAMRADECVCMCSAHETERARNMLAGV